MEILRAETDATVRDAGMSDYKDILARRTHVCTGDHRGVVHPLDNTQRAHQGATP
jgi:hypothetical protein